MKYDVLVAGGGGAGLAAAVTAARLGARTLLVERHGALGGMATVALVHSICGLYLLRDEPEPVFAHPGFPTEFARRLIAAGASPGPVRMGRVDVLLHSPSGLAAVADAVVRKCPNLDVRLHTELGAVSGNGTLESVDLYCRGRRDRVTVAAAVDASGDAVLAHSLGLTTNLTPSPQLQRPAFIYMLQRVETGYLSGDGRLKIAHQIAGAVRDGILDSGALGAHFRVNPDGEVSVTIDLAGRPNYDPTSPAQLTELEQQGRHIAIQLTAFLQQTHPGFEQAHISAFPTRVGVRESRRVRGLATLTQEDVLLGTIPPDSVALGTWPIELRERHTGPRWRFPEGNRPTHIPLRALKVRNAANMWVAGRCISCDHEAQASIRVIGTCMATGQAAGAAAALQAANGVPPEAQVVRAAIESAHIDFSLPNVP